METVLEIGFGVVLGIYLFMMIAMLVFENGTIPYRNGYKQGQVDAINGKIKYHKVERTDFSITWEEIKF